MSSNCHATAPRRGSDPEARSPGAQQLDALVRAEGDFVWRVLLRFGVCETDAEDAMQDVFLVAHRRMADFDGASPRPWLFAICRRVASLRRRTQARARRRMKVAVSLGPSTPAADEALARREALALVEDFMAGLDEPLRSTFVLSEIEGMSGPEVAAALETKLNTIYSRVRTLKRGFAKYIEQHRPKRGSTNGDD